MSSAAVASRSIQDHDIGTGHIVQETGLSFFSGRAADQADRLMVELETNASEALKTQFGLHIDVNIWALAIESFACSSFTIIKKQHDIINAATLRLLFGKCAPVLEQCAHMEDPPALVKRMAFLADAHERNKANAFVTNTLMPVLAASTDGGALNAATIPDPRQVGRAKRVRFMFLESKVPANCIQPIDHINRAYTHGVFAILAPLREVVSMYLVLLYQYLILPRQRCAACTTPANSPV